MSKFWSEKAKGLDPYTPGEQPKDKQFIKLNTNENPYSCPPKALAAMQQAVTSDLRLYPDPNADELRQAIADFYNVSKENVFVGNGSDEVLAHAFAGLLKQPGKLLYPDISYSFYPVYCSLFDIESVAVPLNETFEIELQDYQQDNGAILFPNPNAPTGIALSLTQIRSILDNNPGSPVLVDEAYVDFGAETAISLIGDYPNLLVVQTLSKSRSLAGIRVGFAVGDAVLIQGLERVKNSFNPYPLGRVELAGAVAAFQDKAYFEQTCKKIVATRSAIAISLQDIGFEVLPSATNFLLVKPPAGFDAAGLYSSLKDQGILVRHFNKPRISEYLRISIGTDEEMAILMQHLTEIVNA